MPTPFFYQTIQAIHLIQGELVQSFVIMPFDNTFISAHCLDRGIGYGTLPIHPVPSLSQVSRLRIDLR